jgi:hypothetical protein
MTKPKQKRVDQEVKAVAEETAPVVEANKIESALAALLADEAKWKKTTTQDVIEAHWPSIKALIDKRCPVDMIADAMSASGVEVKKSTLLRLITDRKNSGRKSPKTATTRATRPRGKTADGDASPASADVQSKLNYFCTKDGDDAPIGDVADELQQALNVGIPDAYSPAAA